MAVSPKLKETRKYFGALLVGVYEDKKLKLLAELEPVLATNSCALRKDEG